MDKIKPTSSLDVFPKANRAFTLIELLIVMTVMMVLLSLTRPALNSMLGSFQINQAGQDVANMISLGRQEAVKRNREVQVRFYKLPLSGTTTYRGIQLVAIDVLPSGSIPRPLSELHVLPNSVKIADVTTKLSPLLSADTTLDSTLREPIVGVYTNLQWKGFRIRPNGLLTPTITSGSLGNNYLTMVRQNDPDTDYTGVQYKNNFSIVQVNPASGAVTTYRP